MQWLNWGAAYPKGDQDQLFALGDAWKQAASDLKNLEPELLAANNKLSQYYVGDGGAAAVKELAALLGESEYSIPTLVASLESLGADARSAATEIEYTKIQEEIFALMTLWGVLSLMYSAAGSALAPAYLVAARLALEKFASAAAERIGLIMARNAAKKMAAPLVRRIGVPLAKGLGAVNKAPAIIKYPTLAAIGAGGGATIGAGMDAAIQGVQMLEGNRDNGYDLKRTFQTALEWGAGGAVGAPVHGLMTTGLGKLIPSMLEQGITAKGPAAAKLFGETLAGGLGGLAGGGGMYAAGLGNQYHDKGNWGDVDKTFHYQLALGGLGMGGLGGARHGMTPHDGTSHTGGTESNGAPKSNALGENSHAAAVAPEINASHGDQSGQHGSLMEAAAGKSEIGQHVGADQNGAQHSGASVIGAGQEPKVTNAAPAQGAAESGRGGAAATAENARAGDNTGRSADNTGRAASSTENAQSREAAQNRPQAADSGARNAAAAANSERSQVAAGANEKPIPGRGPESKVTGRESLVQEVAPERTPSETARPGEVTQNHGELGKTEGARHGAEIQSNAPQVTRTPVEPGHTPAAPAHEPVTPVRDPAAPVQHATEEPAAPPGRHQAEPSVPNRSSADPGARTPAETSAAAHRPSAEAPVPRPERIPEAQPARTGDAPPARPGPSTPAAERNPNGRADLPENRRQAEPADPTGGVFPVPEPIEAARPSDTQPARSDSSRGGNASDLGSFRGDARPANEPNLTHPELAREIEENLAAVKPEDAVWDPEGSRFILEDGTEIHVRVGESDPGTVAKFTRPEETEARGPDGSKQQPTYEVTVSERARTEDVARAVAHEVAEIRLEQDPAILRDPISETPGEMTPHLGGRFAELKVLDAQLDRALKDPTRTDEHTRLRTEIAEVLDELGMRDPATKETPQRLLLEHDPELSARIEEKTPSLPKETTESAPREQHESASADESPSRPTEHEAEPAWVSPEDPNLTLTPEQNRAAEEFLANSRENEPAVTDAMERMARETNAEMKGLEYRLKDEDSFKRKFATELNENGGDIAAALADMKDSVRYTATWETERYTENVRAAEQNLRDQGYEPVKRKPTWTGEGYRGFNSFWKDTETGQVFEVQFHTPESFQAKMETHGLYDEIRLLPEGNPRRAELEARQNEIFDSVPHPPGAETLVNDGRPANHEAARESPVTRDEKPTEQHPDDTPPPAGHDTEAAWVSPEDPSITLTAEQNRAADEFLARSTENEPAVTDAMERMARETNAEMQGLDYRLKEEDSFKRKFSGALEENGGDIAAALADMKDSVRYTATWETERYTENVRAAEQHLLDEGYEPVKRKPTWGDEGYRGYNSFWKDPKTGQVFEVQFHTPESFDAKMRTHDLYDEIRLLPEGDPRRIALEAEQNAIFNSVPHPPRAETLSTPLAHMLEEPGKPSGVEPPAKSEQEPAKPVDEQPRHNEEQIPRPVSSDELLEDYGMPKSNQAKFQEVVNEYGYVMDVRPTNPATPAWLENGAMPKGLDIKVKTINELDPYIGASPEKVGLVGFFEPTRPVEGEVPPHLWDEVNKRYDKRLEEWNEFQESMEKYKEKGKYSVEDGVVHGFDRDGTQRPLTGDHDVFDIRHPNGELLSAEEYWAVVNDMISRDMGVMHGAHMYWKTMDPPVHEGIYQTIVDSHKPGGEPLVRFSPDAEPILVDSSTPVGRTVEPAPVREPAGIEPPESQSRPGRAEAPHTQEELGGRPKSEIKTESEEIGPQRTAEDTAPTGRGTEAEPHGARETGTPEEQKAPAPEENLPEQSPPGGEHGVPPSEVTPVNPVHSIIDEALAEHPGIAKVIKDLVDDSQHPLDLTRALLDPTRREATLEFLKELADGRELNGRTLAEYTAEHPGEGPLFDRLPDEVNFHPDGQSRLDALVAEAKAMDPVRQVGPHPTAPERAAVGEYARRLLTEVQAAVKAELARLTEGVDGARTSLRTKSGAGILDKVQRMFEGGENRPPRPNYQVGDVIDAVGARITVENTRELAVLLERIQEHFGIGEHSRILEIENMYATPKGRNPEYRVIPLVVRIDIDGIPHTYELQLTTQRASIAADINHNTIYKPYVETTPEQLGKINKMFAEAAALDQRETRVPPEQAGRHDEQAVQKPNEQRAGLESPDKLFNLGEKNTERPAPTRPDPTERGGTPHTPDEGNYPPRSRPESEHPSERHQERPDTVEPDAAPAHAELPERLQQIYDQGEDLPGGRGRSYYTPDDDLLQHSRIAKHHDKDGYYILDMHGTSKAVIFDTTSLSARDAAMLIRADPKWNNQPVWLMSCETGQGKNSFARQLADELNVKVMAPTELVWGKGDGTSVVASALVPNDHSFGEKFPPDGKWQSFPKPKKKKG
ncbi:hypothetical protein LTV02_26935 [Nocardia yamanashiensis]|uniref:WXG100-like domain-containing protein n=1 Tax=Nocardia yamanashiensis TaxID=209247 RepID=UPI001E50E166|nr:hypothetical protein [Nocardia yamanashiensis]UGT39677.1 hypothetical protein LTV02_26935 [Nocardia yamanashiensis]